MPLSQSLKRLFSCSCSKNKKRHNKSKKRHNKSKTYRGGYVYKGSPNRNKSKSKSIGVASIGAASKGAASKGAASKGAASKSGSKSGSPM